MKFDSEEAPIGSPLLKDGNTIDLTVPSLIETQKNPVGQCGEERIEGKNHWWTFYLDFWAACWLY